MWAFNPGPGHVPRPELLVHLLVAGGTRASNPMTRGPCFDRVRCDHSGHGVPSFRAGPYVAISITRHYKLA